MLSTSKYYSSSGIGYVASTKATTQNKADTDGKITRAEFINARPANVSREEAAAQFAALDTQKTGSLKRSEILAALKANAPGATVAAKLPDTALATLLLAVNAKAKATKA